METVEEKSLSVIEDQSLDVLAQAKSIEVTDQQTYEVAGFFTKACTELKSKIVDFFKPMKTKAKAAHQEICDNEKRHLGPVDEAIKVFKGKMTTWYMAEQKKIREEEDRLRQESIRQQEDEKLKKAEELAASGQKEEAEEVLSSPTIEPVFVPKKVEKPKGVSYRDNWKFKIVDETRIPREYLTADLKAIGDQVKATKDKTEIPGIEVYNEKIQVTG